MTDRIRLLLAEDHETVREGLRALFATMPEIDIVEEVGDTDAVVARVRAVSPDLLLLDLSMKKPVPAKSASALIDQRISELSDWRGTMLAKVRAIIHGQVSRFRGETHQVRALTQRFFRAAFLFDDDREQHQRSGCHQEE